MRLATRSAAAAALAIGLALSSSVPASAAQVRSLGAVSCGQYYAWVASTATGATTHTVYNGPSSWSHSWPSTNTALVRSSSFSTHYASSAYVSTTKVISKASLSCLTTVTG